MGSCAGEAGESTGSGRGHILIPLSLPFSELFQSWQAVPRLGQRWPQGRPPAYPPQVKERVLSQPAGVALPWPGSWTQPWRVAVAKGWHPLTCGPGPLTLLGWAGVRLLTATLTGSPGEGAVPRRGGCQAGGMAASSESGWAGGAALCRRQASRPCPSLLVITIPVEREPWTLGNRQELPGSCPRARRLGLSPR